MNQNLREISPQAKIQSDVKYDKHLNISDSQKHSYGGYFLVFPRNPGKGLEVYYKRVLLLFFSMHQLQSRKHFKCLCED